MFHIESLFLKFHSSLSIKNSKSISQFGKSRSPISNCNNHIIRISTRGQEYYLLSLPPQTSLRLLNGAPSTLPRGKNQSTVESDNCHSS